MSKLEDYGDANKCLNHALRTGLWTGSQAGTLKNPCCALRFLLPACYATSLCRGWLLLPRMHAGQLIGFLSVQAFSRACCTTLP